MAITRTQIARQLYIKGGVVNPDGRRGFFKGAEQDSKDKGTNISPGTVGSGSNKGSRRDPEGPKDDLETYNYDPSLKEPSTGLFKPDAPPPKKPKETNFEKVKRKFNPFPLATSVLNKLSNSKLARMNNALQRQNYIDSLNLDIPEEKEEYDRIMNQLGGLGMDIIAGPKVIGETTGLPPSMGFSTPVFEMPQAPPGMLKTQFKTVDGISTLADAGVGDVLGKGYDEYLDRFENLSDDNDMSMVVTDPCKGPNPPAYCFIGQDADENQEAAVARNLAGLTPRMGGSMFDFDQFAADGGRIGAMDGGMMSPEGGIMDLESGRQMYFLGKLVKKATRAVKKITKSPIGKAALLYGLGAMGGSFGAGKGLFSKGMFNPGNMMRGLIGAKGAAGTPGIGGMEGLFGKLGLTKGYGGLMPTFKGGMTLATILPLLAGKTDEEKQDILKDYYAQNQLDPATTARQMGSEFDFYNYNLAEGGMPSKEPVAKETMPLLDMDGKEMDFRAEGGFVPIGRMEKADDVPARLSKNEFVFTADAVRNAGEGDIDKGAEVMYNMMKNLESGGDVSEESQGLEGAKEMFQTSQRLGEVI
jgi:hypothetical protein